MRRISLIFILTIFFLLGSCSCNKDKKGLRPFADYVYDEEDNDTRSSANSVSTQNPIVGFFNEKGNIGDKDYYRVTFSLKQTSYKVVQTAVPGIDTLLTFYRKNGSFMFKVDDNGVGEAEKIWDLYPVDDEIILVVESKTGFNDKVPYIINFIPRQKDTIDEIEPNNEEETAAIIRLDDAKRGLISPTGDIDFYEIISPDKELHDYSITIETFSNLDISFMLIDKVTGQAKIINAFAWGGSETFPYLSTEKGDYVLRLTGTMKPYDKKDPIYYLEVKELPSELNGETVYYEREMNDSSLLATELISGYEVIGAYFPAEDEDWFSFDCFKKPKSVDISVSRVRGIDPIIEIYDKDMKLIEKIDANGMDSIEQASLHSITKGKYYVKLYSANYSQLYYKLFFNIRY